MVSSYRSSFMPAMGEGKQHFAPIPLLFLCVSTSILFLRQDGTVGHDLANAVAIAEDGSVVIAGHSRGDFLGLGTVEGKDSSSLSPRWLGGDFAAIKLDSSGAEVWRWQVRRQSPIRAAAHRGGYSHEGGKVLR